MFSRIHPAIRWFGLSGLALLVLVGVLAWPSLPWNQSRRSGTIVLYCAAGLRGPVEEIARAYEEEHGVKVEVRYEASQSILTQARVSRQGDVFLPADESYIELARADELIAEIVAIGRMKAMLIVPVDNPKKIQTWNQLLAEGVSIAQAKPEIAAVGKLTRAHLEKSGRWEPLQRRTKVTPGTVDQVANAVALKSVDAGIVWDVVARPMPKLTMIDLPELAGIEANVQAAVLTSSKQPTEALRFVRYLAGSDRGLLRFRDHGFTQIASGDPALLKPTLLLYAGAMLRPAIEETVKEFEQREGVAITTVYDGCGLLVSAMETKARPDLFLACDARFMEQVQDRFDAPQTVSTNQLVIAVKKGNPHNVTALKDLAKPGLKVGVGHEQQCALGTITRETFLQTGLHAAVSRNVVVQSPTGDMLVNMLLVGSLDVAIVYRSNVLEHPERIEYTPVTGIACATPAQPIAVGKQTAFPNLSRRLVQAIQSAESRRRFEASGFGWQGKP